jgi:hypothetical protein
MTPENESDLPPEDQNIIQNLRSNILAITTSLQLMTRHESGTLQNWKNLYQDKKVTLMSGADLGVAKIHLDSASHVFVTVGGSTFPVGHLQALVDAGSLLVVDS